jgi:hypothetical protein
VVTGLPWDQRRGAKRGSGWLRTTSATVASAGPPPGAGDDDDEEEDGGGGRRNAEECRIVGRCGAGVGGVGARAMVGRVGRRCGAGVGVPVSKLETLFEGSSRAACWRDGQVALLWLVGLAWLAGLFKSCVLWSAQSGGASSLAIGLHPRDSGRGAEPIGHV